NLQCIEDEARAAIEQANDLKSLNDLRVRYLGKKGPIQEAMKLMKDLTPEERKELGQVSNRVKAAIQEAVNLRQRALEQEKLEAQLKNETIDVTLPGRRMALGSPHVLQQVIREIEDFFIGLGYTIAEGPQVETDHYNFELLNIPKGHPARDMQD